MCKDGETMLAEDGCNECVCNNGDWTCTEKACEEPQTCEEGASKPAGDGCNTCTCFEGSWGCTLLDCAPDACQPGETKKEDCNTCECYQGSWSCTDKGCGETSTTGTDTGETSTTGTDTGETSTTGTDTGTDTGMDTGTDTGNGESCLPNDPYQIDGATIVGDTLKVSLIFGGGCEAHAFDLCWDGIFAESFPVQTWIALSHEDNDDLCDALLMEVRDIDLTGLKTAYQEGYQTQNGTITIHLDGWAQALDYTF
jgi:hypothetical protein